MLVFLGRLIRVLGVLLLVRLVLRALAARSRAAERPTGPGGARELVRDRVCNTFVPKERALSARVGGRDEFFCSAACRDRALGEGARALPAP